MIYFLSPPIYLKKEFNNGKSTVFIRLKSGHGSVGSLHLSPLI
jgi:small nuclear ribonucleoprotein (snRNP)-like protein